MAVGSRLYVYRSELGRFETRWPGNKTLPGNPTIAHGKDLTVEMVGPQVPLKYYSGPKAVTLRPDGGWIDEFNMGSKLIVGMHFDGVTFTIPNGYPDVGITFAHCKFTGTPSNKLTYIDSGTAGTSGGVELINCTFDGTDWINEGTVRNDGSIAYSAKAAINYPTCKVRWCLFQRFDRMLRLSPNAIVENTIGRWIDPFYGDVHQSLISAQLNPPNNAIVRKNKLLGRRQADPTEVQGISACITHYNDNVFTEGPFTIEDNYISGGGEYTTYLGGQNDTGPGFYHTQNLIVRNNVFGRDFSRMSGNSRYAYAVSQDPSLVWQNNTWGPLGPYNLPGDEPEGTILPPRFATGGTANIKPA